MRPFIVHVDTRTIISSDADRAVRINAIKGFSPMGFALVVQTISVARTTVSILPTKGMGDVFVLLICLLFLTV